MNEELTTHQHKTISTVLNVINTIVITKLAAKYLKPHELEEIYKATTAATTEILGTIETQNIELAIKQFKKQLKNQTESQ